MTARHLALAGSRARGARHCAVLGTVPLIRQDSPNVVWSALATRMGAWKAGSTLAVKDVMESRNKRSDTMLLQLNGT